ncbi:MAG: AAA family ATPase [Myxococcales bacterium]|nr:AAA family ATPase [Myxococcales bacterium]MCB9754479.1 AAA family ATPase [Myxococcales bacterium]
MSERRRICLVGVRGVGKSTLVRSLVESMHDVDYVVGSAVLRELAGPEFARFDHLTPARKQRYREDAIRWMEDRQRATQMHILCDGHTALLDESTGRVTPVFTDLDCRFFRELILLEAPVELVLSRRASDPRKRRNLDPHVIASELQGERETCARLAREWKMTLHRLPPADDPEVAQRLLELLAP